MKKITLLILFIFSSTIFSQNLRRLNKDIVDENNNEIILRSAGLGGWMLQEPYMFNYSSGANTQHEFKAKLNNLVGNENTELFFESWLDNFVTLTFLFPRLWFFFYYFFIWRSFGKRYYLFSYQE